MNTYMMYSHIDFNKHLIDEKLLDIPEWFREEFRPSLKMEIVRKHTDTEMLLNIQEEMFIEM